MYVRCSTMYEKAAFLLAGTGFRRKNSTVACGFSPIKIHYSDYPKKINEVYVFSIKYVYKTPKLHFIAMLIVECCNHLFHCNHTCVGMVSVTSASHYQSRPSLMFVRGLIPLNWPRVFWLYLYYASLNEKDSLRYVPRWFLLIRSDHVDWACQ